METMTQVNAQLAEVANEIITVGTQAFKSSGYRDVSTLSTSKIVQACCDAYLGYLDLLPDGDIIVAYENEIDAIEEVAPLSPNDAVPYAQYLMDLLSNVETSYAFDGQHYHLDDDTTIRKNLFRYIFNDANENILSMQDSTLLELQRDLLTGLSINQLDTNSLIVIMVGALATSLVTL